MAAMLPHIKHATSLLTTAPRRVPGVLQCPKSALSRARYASQAATATAADTDEVQQSAAKKVKRNVALHIGYVGTEYSGLQANRELPEFTTVEGVLEKAILDAGLITSANYGDFRKTKWTRSSRTDKGVHSLSTVIGLRILIDDNCYVTDPEGIGYAHAINQHLPANIRVFCVQRTNKSFNARTWCGNRTYEYYLPASLLGLETVDGSSAGDQSKLALLREVLQQYCGYRPYHNYCGNRGQYVDQKGKAARRKARRAAAQAATASGAANQPAADDVAGATATQQQCAQPNQQQQQGQVARSSSSSHARDLSGSQQPPAVSINSSKAEATSDTEVEMEGDDIQERQQYAAAAAAGDGGISGYLGEGPVAPELQWQQQVAFLSAPDPDDPVVKSHYRMIRSFTAGESGPLVEGGVPCIRLEVCGDSFMLHQIRHMVGTAVAIVRGVMPRELLRVSLSAPGRVTLPRAPPHSLLLSGCTFSPFPAGWGLDTPLVARWTGDRLRLREKGQQGVAEFRAKVFDEAINNLLLHPDWELWSKQMLPRYAYAAGHTAAAVSSHVTWYAELKAKRAAEAADKTAKAVDTAVDKDGVPPENSEAEQQRQQQVAPTAPQKSACSIQ